MDFKRSVYEQCRLILKERLSMYKKTLDELVESSADEGENPSDPSEAGVAMMQMEQASIRTQFNEAMTMKRIIDAISPDPTFDHISKGSLVKSGSNYYYISVALGKMSIEGETVFAISPQSPLGSKLLGCTKGDIIVLNGKSIVVEELG